MSPLRVGILGTARTARKFVRGVAPSSRVVVANIASRDQSRVEAFAREFGLPRHSPSYEELLADPDIDAVYNPLPNSLHADWSIRAVQAGKQSFVKSPWRRLHTKRRK